MSKNHPIIPPEVLNQHVAVLGKTGSGKSSVLRLLVEGVLDQQERVCIIDPKGDWFGLKLSASGNRAGYPIIIFGGAHADVPINQYAGSNVAELIATSNRPCIIDFGGWMVGERTRFFIDFASSLFRNVKSSIKLIIDEAHNFAPQGKVLDPDAGKMLHWANRLASEGRGKGIVILSASQRPQKVHKDFLTCAETLIAMRVIHPLDRKAIKEWIDGCPDADKGKEVLDSLASMQRGEGWVWSPEIGYGPRRVVFPMFKTFDSFNGPVGDEQVQLKGWAEVDLEEVKSKLAKVVEEAKANDPKELKNRIAELELQTSKQVRATSVLDQEHFKTELKSRYESGYADGYKKAAELAYFNIGNRVLWDRAGQAAMQVVHDDLKRFLDHDRPKAPAKLETFSKILPAIVHHRQPQRTQSPQQRQPRTVSEPSGEVGKGGLRRILIALAQRPGLTNRQIGVRAGLSSSSGTFTTYLSTARKSGWIWDEGDRRFITDEGAQALGDYEPLPSGQALLQHWLGDLGNSGAARILQALAEAYPGELTNEQVGEATGMSHKSGTFTTYLSKLRTLELIQGGRGSLKASDELFEGGE